MNYIIIMQVLHSRQHLTHQTRRIILVKLLISHNPIEHLTPRAVLHHYVDVFAVDIGLVEFDDVGVVYFWKDE